MASKYTINFLRHKIIQLETSLSGVTRDEAELYCGKKLAALELAATALGMTKLKVRQGAWKGTADQVAKLVDAWYGPEHGGPSYESMNAQDVLDHKKNPCFYDTIFFIQ